MIHKVHSFLFCLLHNEISIVYLHYCSTLEVTQEAATVYATLGLQLISERGSHSGCFYNLNLLLWVRSMGKSCVLYRKLVIRVSRSPEIFQFALYTDGLSGIFEDSKMSNSLPLKGG